MMSDSDLMERRPTLSFSVKLGQFYDGSKFSFLSDLAWNEDRLASAGSKYTPIGTLREFINENGWPVGLIELDLQVAAQCGLVSSQGHDLFGAKKWRPLEGIAIQSGSRILNFQQLTLDPNAYDRAVADGATHIVIGVEYGARVVFNAQVFDNNDESIADQLNRIRITDDATAVSVFHDGDFAAEGSQIKNLQEAHDFMAKLRTDFEADKSAGRLFGVPISVYLLPLHLLKSGCGRMTRKIGDQTLEACRAIFEHLDDVCERATDLLSTCAVRLNDEIFKEMQAFIEAIRGYRAQFAYKVKTLFVQAKRVGADDEALMKWCEAREETPFAREHIDKWMETKLREFATFDKYLQLLDTIPNVRFAFKKQDLDSLKSEQDSRPLVMFTFADMLTERHPHLADMQTYLEDDLISADKGGFDASEGWCDANLAETIMSSIQSFVAFARRNHAHTRFGVTQSAKRERVIQPGTVLFYATGDGSARRILQLPGRPAPPSGPKQSGEEESIELEWTAPSAGAKDVTGYRIYHQAIGTDTWSVHDIQGVVNRALLGGLSSGTPYVFRIAAVCPAGESEASEPSEVFSTKKTAPYAERLLEHAEKLETGGDENWYQIPMKQTYVDRDLHYKRFDVGQEMGAPHQNKVVLMVGATGAGKTTLINGLTNYFFDVRHECDFRLQLVPPETNKPESMSQTDIISEYVLYAFHDSPVPYTVTFIDTPGFGDTRGLERDDMLVNMMRTLFRESVSHVDAICFTVQASAARLTVTQKYVFNAILAIFGKDVKPNIFIMITFADGKTPPVMDALREFDMHGQSCFKFNNSVFSVKQDVAAGDVVGKGSQPTNERAINQMFWTMAYESYANFFSTLGQVESRSVMMTREVLEKRRQLEQEIEILSLHITQGLNELTNLRNRVPIVEELFAREASNKNYRRRVKKPKSRRVQFSNTEKSQRYVTNCMVCHTTCHPHCQIAKDEGKAKCWAMTDGVCRVCRNKCHWSKHVNRDFYFEDYESDEEVTVDDMKREYDAAMEGLTTQENVLLGIAQKYEGVQKQVVNSIKIVTDCLNELERIALRKNLLTTVDYVDTLIDITLQEKRPGYQSRVTQLRKARERAVLISQIKSKNFNPLDYDDPKLAAILEDARQKKDKKTIWTRLKTYTTSIIA